MQKAAAYKVQGMHRDASPSNFKPEYAFEIVNMRLITDEEGSAFSLVNENGTTFACSLEDGVTWIPLGQCPTTDSIIVFAISPGNAKPNAIFSIKEKAGQWTSTTLFQGELKFQEDSPIETLFNYETEYLKKVYWIDGINPLRCINVAQESYSDNPTQFDSVLPLTDNQLAVNIDRLSGGSFKAGVIQYYLTYFNKYRTESPIVWTSPLLYLANQERGAETDTNVNTAFKFDIIGLDSVNWEYVRLYSVFRSSIDTEPSANIVAEVKINNGTITAYDYGTSNTAIVASDLYFVGAKAVKAGTMTVKDQVLFLGNLKVGSKIEPELGDSPAYDLKTDTYKSRPFKISETEGTYYKYDNQLDNTESISTYKNGETYRFGYQLQDKWGNWSNPIFIEDKEIDFAPKMNYTDGDECLQLAQPSMNITALLEGFRDKGFIAARPLVVYPDVRDRKILCQGVVCPTVYNLKDRVDNSPYAQASWFMRPNIPGDIWGTNKVLPASGHFIDDYPIDYAGLCSLEDIQTGEVADALKVIASTDGITDNLDPLWLANTRLSILLDEVPSQTDSNTDFNQLSSSGGWLGKSIVEKGTWVEFRHNYALKSKGHSYGEYIHDSAGFPGINKTLSDADRAKVTNLWKSSSTTGSIDNSDVPIESKFIDGNTWDVGIKYNTYKGLARGAEIDSTRGIATLPVNRFWKGVDDSGILRYALGRTLTLSNQYNTGSSAYYVDANIVTLNSPEIELGEELYTIPTENYKFRIVGMIPLTANISDISLELYSPSLYSHDQKPNKELGLNKLHIHTENIGYTGYRSLVAANPYLAWFHMKATDMDGNTTNTYNSWGNVLAGHLLYPWQSTGNIQTFMSSDSRRTSYSKLKRKVLSNARFSAISYYLPNTKWWYPSYQDTTSIQTWTSTDNSIQKFQISEKLHLPDIVYKGNIDSLAMQDVNGPSYDLYYYTGIELFQGNNKTDRIDLDESLFYKPTITLNSEIVTKGMSIASSVKYKSSPHFAIFLGGANTKDDNMSVLEILPTLASTVSRTERLYTVDPTTVVISLEDLDSQITERISVYEESEYNIPSIGNIKFRIQGLYDVNSCELNLFFDTKISNKIKTLVSKNSSREVILDLTDQTSGGNNCYLYVLDDFGEFYQDIVFTSLTLSKSSNGKITLKLEEYPGAGYLCTIELNVSVEIRTLEDSLSGLNLVGKNSQELIGDNLDSTLRLGRVYESEKISSIPIQQCINIPSDVSYNLPEKYYPKPKNASSNPINYGWLWLGELYKDNVPTFGGTSDYALQNNKWEIAGNIVPLSDGATLEWSIGDTYYQRFDTLKTYAYADTDENSVIDITSFMVETRLNIDGRYDRNRGQESNLNMSPKNFNLFNKVYTQRNNFFTYSITPEDAAKRLSFPTQITWSLVKTPGENIDQWLNTTMSAIIDLDGRKGELTSLETLGNEIIAFQEKGIANIIYNPRTQITATDGTPIYIANSTKVEGFKYISDNVGSQDKWSIVSTPNGLYFVDLYNKGIYKFNGQLEDISNAQGFHSWCIQNLNKDSKILGYYDYKNKDVYFMNSDWGYPCLAFSEFTNTFSSFYSYENAKLAYLQGEGIWIKDDGSIYTHQTGSYNSFFGKNGEDYHVTIVCNQDGNLSKIFNNIEFRADSWEGNTAIADKSIDYLAIETEYQKKTEEPLVFKKHGISNLKKKFNVWRANIPREQGTRNRFRDVWVKVTLGGRGNARKTRLNDIVIYYT